MIRQIIDKNETVQTGLTVDVNGIRISYRQIKKGIGYEFYAIIYDKGPTLAEIDSAIDEVVSAMCSQSHNQESEWRVINREICTETIERYGMYFVTVRFGVFLLNNLEAI